MRVFSISPHHTISIGDYSYPMPYKSSHLSVLFNFDNAGSISTIVHSPQILLLKSSLICLFHCNEGSLSFDITLISLPTSSSSLIGSSNFHTFHSIPPIPQFSITIIPSNQITFSSFHRVPAISLTILNLISQFLETSTQSCSHTLLISYFDYQSHFIHIRISSSTPQQSLSIIIVITQNSAIPFNTTYLHYCSHPIHFIYVSVYPIIGQSLDSTNPISIYNHSKKHSYSLTPLLNSYFFVSTPPILGFWSLKLYSISRPPNSL